MLPIHFEQSNFTYTKPESMTDEQCSDLNVFKGVDNDGVPFILSCWQLSKEDLEDIQRTGKVWLNISSNGMPPACIFTENTFE